MKILILIAYRNVRLHWRHSFAAILSVVASFYALVIFQGYMADIKEIYFDGYRHRAMLGDVLIENRDLKTQKAKSEPWTYYLTLEQQEKIKNFVNKYQSEVFASVRFLDFQGLVTNGRTSTLFLGMSHDLEQGAHLRKHWRWSSLYGVPLVDSTNQSSVVIGQSLGNILDCLPEKKIFAINFTDGGYIPENRPFKCYRDNVQLSLVTPGGQLNAMDFDIVGLVDAGYKEIDDKYVGLSIENAQMLMNTNKVTFQSIALNDPTLISNFIDKFKIEVLSQEPSLHIVKWQEHVQGELYRKTMSLLGIFRNFVVIVILSISVLSVANTMVKIVKERTKEVGTLRSLGFFQKQVGAIFIFESLFLSAIGISLGAVSCLMATVIINAAHFTYKAGMLSEPVLFKIRVIPLDYAVNAILLLVVTALASYLTTRNTLNKKIVDCLSHS